MNKRNQIVKKLIGEFLAMHKMEHGMELCLPERGIFAISPIPCMMPLAIVLVMIKEIALTTRFKAI